MTPRSAVVRAVNDTKDNDTIASIVGAAVVRCTASGASGKVGCGPDGRTMTHDDGKVFSLIEEPGRNSGSSRHPGIVI
jgi:hypothetical protein